MTFVAFSVSLLLLLLSCLQVRSCAIDCKQYNDTLKSLDSLRNILVKLEDTIVFSLIERSKYPRNLPLYDERARLVYPPYTSLFDFFIKQSEAVQRQAGPYVFEEENAYYPIKLAHSLVPPCTPVLHRGDAVNQNGRIMDMYINWLLPNITAEGNDGKYAATAAADLTCLQALSYSLVEEIDSQALSKRIHYGKFVAESKFTEDIRGYTNAIIASDNATLVKKLTNSTVEQAVKRRVQHKMQIFSQDVDGGLKNSSSGSSNKIDLIKTVSQLYDYVINITKDVELEYLLNRLK